MSISQWAPATNPPPMVAVEWGYKLASNEVLAFTKHGQTLVATYEQEDDAPEWFTADSERWNLHDTVTHWMPLPLPPETF